VRPGPFSPPFFSPPFPLALRKEPIRRLKKGSGTNSGQHIESNSFSSLFFSRSRIGIWKKYSRKELLCLLLFFPFPFFFFLYPGRYIGRGGKASENIEERIFRREIFFFLSFSFLPFPHLTAPEQGQELGANAPGVSLDVRLLLSPSFLFPLVGPKRENVDRKDAEHLPFFPSTLPES